MIRPVPCWIPGVSSNESERVGAAPCMISQLATLVVVAKPVSVDSDDVVNNTGLL